MASIVGAAALLVAAPGPRQAPADRFIVKDVMIPARDGVKLHTRKSGVAKSQGSEAVTKISDLHRRWSKDADYKDGYDALGEEFDLAHALIEARTAAGLSQAQLARRMKTSQSYIARIEGGKVRPSTDALGRFAEATRTRLRIIFEPSSAR